MRFEAQQIDETGAEEGEAPGAEKFATVERMMFGVMAMGV